MVVPPPSWDHGVLTRVDGGPSYEELARAVEELREENARPRRLLGFETRASDGHRQAERRRC